MGVDWGNRGIGFGGSCFFFGGGILGGGEGLAVLGCVCVVLGWGGGLFVRARVLGLSSRGCAIFFVMPFAV